ncbi:DNA photolyase, putative [Talaromyces stipitatus ATCC 10500]|uniref:DNA photolyase, putative n=1 Tax=Talaromyces stipitatus (strain ATCC 10500 / CBS 375.48 / QM 6759 / NRRL 1006) TaxID=441959 RepID=B8MMM4_TALSN|nr:DNA photolyase, putative [Talaromyces stipitatus ATCC 10500]EED13778.1 DNA photolyase, putative [Talaromyces stipitatus ATCC 10500]
MRPCCAAEGMIDRSSQIPSGRHRKHVPSAILTPYRSATARFPNTTSCTGPAALSLHFTPQSDLTKLWKAWGITHLVFEKDTDAYAKHRDEQIIKLVENAGTEILVSNGRPLFNPDYIVRKNNGEPTLSINKLLKASENMDSDIPDKPLGTPESVPDPWEDAKMNLDSLEHNMPEYGYNLLLGQLLFGEMFFSAQAALGHTSSQTFGNKIAHSFHGGCNLLIQSHQTESSFEITRMPSIQKKPQHGFVNGVCFLTRGGCYVSWEQGVEVFQEWLIDHEEASNVGNWMWLSCTAFFSQYYRCYSPIAFGRRWDPNGDFVRRYCPELKDYDKKYIYEPWRAPIKDQKNMGMPCYRRWDI